MSGFESRKGFTSGYDCSDNLSRSTALNIVNEAKSVGMKVRLMKDPKRSGKWKVCVYE